MALLVTRRAGTPLAPLVVVFAEPGVVLGGALVCLGGVTVLDALTVLVTFVTATVGAGAGKILTATFG